MHVARSGYRMSAFRTAHEVAPLRLSKPPSATTADLVRELEAIIKLGSPARRVFIDKVKPNIEKIEHLSAALGTNKVDPGLNDGQFTGLLTTDLRQVTDTGDSTFGRLCFSQFKPTDLAVTLGVGGADAAGVASQLKGTFEGQTNAYVVNFFFRFQESGLVGLLSSIGEYEQSPDMPQRLLVKFNKMRLRQAPSQAADAGKRQAWLNLLRPHNPMMDENGVAEVELPKAPYGHLDYLVMLPDWHVSKGNFGSVVVLKRA